MKLELPLLGAAILFWHLAAKFDSTACTVIAAVASTLFAIALIVRIDDGRRRSAELERRAKSVK